VLRLMLRETNLARRLPVRNRALVTRPRLALAERVSQFVGNAAVQGGLEKRHARLVVVAERSSLDLAEAKQIGFDSSASGIKLHLINNFQSI
jgi:hypothetical protein